MPICGVGPEHFKNSSFHLNILIFRECVNFCLNEAQLT